MRLWSTGWYIACSFFCVYAYPTYEHVSNAQEREIEPSDLQSEASSYVFHGSSDFASSEDMASELDDLREEPKKTMIPIKNHAMAKNKPVLLPLILEPDAEMLPLNYKGVKPPGVDHMELISLEPQEMASNPKVTQTLVKEETIRKSDEHEQGRKHQAATMKHDTHSVEDDKGGNKAVHIETGKKGSSKKEEEKGQYSEKAGKKKTHFDEDHDEGYYADDSRRKGEDFYHSEGGHNQNRKSKGFREKYHKDEYKKDADFYNNGHKGGSFVQHGRYDEKHVADENGFEKGKSHDAGYGAAVNKKQGKFEEGYSDKDAKGHKAEQGYADFFKKYDEYGRKGATANRKEQGYKKVHSGKSR